MRGSRAAACLVLASVWLACGEPVAPGGEAEPRPPAPDFTLTDLEGQPITLSELRGKTVIIDFWATWCPPCVFQVPELNKLHAAHAAAGDLVVVGVSVDVEGEEVVRPWVQEQGIGYRVAIGDDKLAARFGAVGFPTLVVVDPEGRIHSLHVGLIEYPELEKLAGAAASQRAT